MSKKLELQVYWTEDFASLKYLHEIDQHEVLSMDAEITRMIEKLNMIISKNHALKSKADWPKAEKLNQKIDDKIEKMNTFFQFKIDRINEAS